MLHFGTDGVRGRVGAELTEELVSRLGMSVAEQWPDSLIVIGHDGRESGPTLAAAFARGATSRGREVHYADLLPTPGIARIAQRHRCVGVAITASHNPWQDNGVKVFAPGGRKLTDDEQNLIQARWQAIELSQDDGEHEAASWIDVSYESEYVTALLEGINIDQLNEMSVLVDCAHGATSRVASAITKRLGLRATVLNAEPNGKNINDGCGAVHPDALVAQCARQGVVGVALDGDGDRLIAVDERGNVVDGDRVIALMAIDLAKRGLLAHDTVVVTSMTNLGFHHAMRMQQITVVTTDVGDRHVLAAMEAGGYVLGGEQSGHIVNSLYATTGDGLLAAVLMLDLVRRAKKPLYELAENVMKRVPQLLRNVRVQQRPSDLEALLATELAEERARLGAQGRIVVRSSGTEPLVRIMVEAPTDAAAHEVANRLERILLART